MCLSDGGFSKVNARTHARTRTHATHTKIHAYLFQKHAVVTLIETVNHVFKCNPSVRAFFVCFTNHVHMRAAELVPAFFYSKDSFSLYPLVFVSS